MSIQIKKTFEQRHLYPINDETLNIAELNKKGKIKSPKLYLQFYPSIIPTISTTSNLKNLRHKHQKPNILNNPFLESNLDNTQMLDEVIIEASKREARLEELRRTSWGGRIDLWDTKKKTKNTKLGGLF